MTPRKPVPYFVCVLLLFVYAVGLCPRGALAQGEVPVSVLDSLWTRAASGELKFRDMVEPSRQALADLGEDAVPYLVIKLSTRDAREMHTLVDIFKRIGSPSVPYLVRELGSDDVYVVRLACRSLGPIQDSSAVGPLLDLLYHADYTVRSGAATALGKIAHPSAEPGLIETLNDEVEIPRKSAAVALGRLGSSRSIRPLLDALRDDYFGVRYGAAGSLVKLKESSEGPLLGELDRYVERFSEPVADDDFYIRLVISCLGKMGSDRAVKPLIRVLESSAGNLVRAEAAEALGNIGGKDAIKSLGKFRPSGDRFLDYKAAQALQKLSSG